ncbi:MULTISPECIES: lytic transglycosylase domain-containing protein [Pseudomonas]|uniref:Lytic transglycosylase domain-containing protein n=1 Tax=Pseudomonas gingeri TaxID=117681 RepID=A0A7Y7X7W5_9PSED|nr:MULTISPECIES: lytic transglycosylase domain-containing protein [Pseudomonas]NWA23950.1 lytic transglycosylase domain-containing protein [Pseudomonas gingeri]NWB94837.1 lytic transglycosylase domain-containing protein [Pseudomonas gingeri]
MATTVARAAMAGSLLLASALASASEIPPPAYQLIARPAGVPSEVLYSVALQESGTRIRGQIVPWPWTLNVAGAGYRFATRSDACRALIIAIQTAGPARVDVGLGQTNVGANGHRYSSPCEGLDPYKNLSVTAQILAEQKSKGGDWITAAGRYHRPAGGEPAARYRREFAKHLSRVTGINLMANNP